MLEQARELFARLEPEYPPVALKFHYAAPEGVARSDEKRSFCEFLRKAQREHRRFYITKEDDDCCGKIALGMAPKTPFTVSGTVGVDYELFRSPAPNVRIHSSYPVIPPGAVNCVEFCPLDLCDFYPDLLLCVVGTEKADILMRATSYISGDLYESKSSCVVSCAWLYAYPYLSGKVNFCITGMHHGLRRRKLYPAGLHMISIPYQKLDEVVTALGEMPWTPIALQEDGESRAELARRQERWHAMTDVYDFQDQK